MGSLWRAFLLEDKRMLTLSEFLCFVLPCALGGFFVGLILGSKNK